MTLRKSAIQSLEDLSGIVVRLKKNEFKEELRILHGNSIGKHVRHVVEFFECLDEANHSLTLNYDKRNRNLLLETDPDYALLRVSDLQTAIGGYQEKALTLVSDYGFGFQEVSTTVYRELVYNIEHCVHHLAIIKIGMEAGFPHAHLPENIGVAFSTQQFQKASNNHVHR